MAKDAIEGLTRRFFDSLAAPEQVIELFEFLPRVYLYIKDVDSRFMHVNRAFLQLHGCKTAEEVVGKSDFDFHPPMLASQYVEEDRRVMESGKALPDQIWLVLGWDQMPRWYVSTKLPLLGRDGGAAGIGGVMRLYEHAGSAPADYHRLTPVMHYVHAHLAEKITAEDLAGRANLSVSQLQREFRRLFKMSPMEYVAKVRLLMARRLLETGSQSVGDVALECGYYDQSHFTRAFRSDLGIPPLEYRKRFARRSEVGRMAVG